MSFPSSSIQLSSVGSYQQTSNIKKQNKQIILQNPFHPLDLSPYDLLQIYKRFQQSRRINRNPKQEIPIESIAQLISSLKGCKPSYIQKCMSQALIKNTISWNDFLKFLDQQSQVRQKILQWLLNQSYTFKYHLKNYYPFRAKIQKSYQFMTFLKIIQFGDEILLLCSIDQFKLLLIDITQKNFHELDRYVKVNPKTNLQQFDILSLNNSSKNKSIGMNAYVNIDMSSKCLKPNKKSNQKSSFSQKLIPINSYNYKSNQISNNHHHLEDQQIYFKKERKNINNVFTVFKDLDVQDSIGLAKITAAKIGDRSFNTNFANSIKQTYYQKIIQHQQKPKQIPIRKIPNIDKVKSKLKSLYQEKSKLSYNPYRVKKSMSVMQQQDSQLNQNKFLNKKMNNTNGHDRKQKNYFLQSMHQTYNDEIKSLAIVYYNMEVVLLRIGKDYNKFCFQEMDTIRIHRERDHKKNQIIQSISLYFHSIIGKWMLLVLIRVENKSESKVHSQSYLVGYQLLEQQNKRKGGFNYSFKANKKSSNISLLQSKKQTFSLKIDNFQAIAMQTQPKCGIHLISYNGKYITYRQEYKQNDDNHRQNQYWKFSYEQRFKDNNFSLSCLALNPKSNKIIFGTAKGVIIIYDIFSHNFKLKKLSSSTSSSVESSSMNSVTNSSSIINVFIKNNQGYILTAKERLIVMDLTKFQQIDDFSVRNDEKLHQKVKGFQIFKNNIITYGSQLKLYDQQIDQIELHKKRMMENMYTWRLNKLKKNSKSINNIAERSYLQIKKEPKSSELVIASQSYFIILSQILEIIVINKLTMNIKFSFILSIPHDSKIMKMALSPNQKLIAILLLNQNIYIFNIYTQDMYAHIKPSNTHKFVTLSFLDQKNEYLLASGTQNGKIALIPYESVPEKPIKDLNYHQNSVTTLEVKKDFMITSGEGGRKIGIWQLPFNAIKHQIKLIDTSNFITRCIGYYLNRSIYFKTIKNDILELNLTQFKVTQIKLPKKYSIYQVDNLTNKIIAIHSTSIQHSNQCTLAILQRQKDMISTMQKDIQTFESKYRQTFTLNLNLQSEVIQIGIIGSEKAILFCQGGGAYIFSFQNQKLSKYITF